MLVYGIETWLDKACVVTPDGIGHDPYLCHFAETLDEALNWCANNRSYAGNEGTGNYLPWHWCISPWSIPGNQHGPGKHYTRDLQECDIEGNLLPNSDKSTWPVEEATPEEEEASCPACEHDNLSNRIEVEQQDIRERLADLEENYTKLADAQSNNAEKWDILTAQLFDRLNAMEKKYEGLSRRHEDPRRQRLGSGKKSGVRENSARSRSGKRPVSRSRSR